MAPLFHLARCLFFLFPDPQLARVIRVMLTNFFAELQRSTSHGAVTRMSRKSVGKSKESAWKVNKRKLRYWKLRTDTETEEHSPARCDNIGDTKTIKRKIERQVHGEIRWRATLIYTM